MSEQRDRATMAPGRASDAILGLSPKVAELVVDIKRFRFVIFEHCGRI